MRRVRIMFVFGLFILAIMAGAAIRPLPALALDDIGTIRGRVLDAETGEPPVGVAYALYQLRAGTWLWAGDGTVGADGFIHTDISPTGSFVLYLDGRDGYVDQMYKGFAPTQEVDTGTNFVPEWPNEVAFEQLAGATPIVVSNGAITTFDTVYLRQKPAPYGAIAGRVTSEFSGGGVSGAVMVMRWDATKRVWVRVAVTQALGNGEYHLVGTAGSPLIGDFRVWCETAARYRTKNGFFPDAPDINSARTIHVDANQTIYGVDMPVFVDGNISGSLLWAGTKKPVGHSYIDWVDAYGDEYGGSADQFGRYFSERMPSATYYGRARQYGSDRPQLTWYGQTFTQRGSPGVTLPLTGSVTGRDVWFSDYPAVSGTVRNSNGRPAVGVSATVYRLVNEHWVRIGSDYTNDDGRYSVICPAGGTYTVKFIDQRGTSTTADDSGRYFGGTTSIWSARRVRVLDGMSANIVFTLTPDEEARAWRVPGDTPSDIALRSSRESFESMSASSVVLASAEDVASAVGAPSLSAALHAPLLLTNRISLYPGILDEIDRVGAQHIYIVGSSSSISSRQTDLLSALGYQVERIDGDSYAQVSENVAARVIAESGDSSDTPTFIASSASITDAVMASSVAAANSGALILVEPGSTSYSAASSVAGLEIKNAVAIGSEAQVPEVVLDRIRSTGAEATRAPSGADAFAKASAFAKFARGNGWAGDVNIGVVASNGLANALAAGSWLSDSGAIVLYTDRTTVPLPTVRTIADSSAARRVRVYGDSRSVSTGALMQAGSALRPVRITTPSAPASVRKYAKFAVVGTVSPRRPANTKRVRIYKWRYVGGKWRSYGYTTAVLSDTATGSRYVAQLRLTASGKWRVRAYHCADSLYSSAWSSRYDYVTVR